MLSTYKAVLRGNQLVKQNTPAVSAVSYVEVLGYHRLTLEERNHFTAFFSAAPILGLSPAVLNQAVQLRQTRKMSLGDALVASTALVHQLTLVTRIIKDFQWISHLDLLNPFTENSTQPPLESDKD